MASKKAIIGIIVVVVLAVIIAIALAGSSSEEEAEVRYDYSAEIVDSFQSASGYTYTPSAGMEYVILHVAVANDSYEDGFSTNSLIFVWKATIDGISYDTALDMYSLPNYKLITIEAGGSATFDYLFEVPEGTALEDITFTYEYQWTFDPPVMEWDDSLL